MHVARSGQSFNFFVMSDRLVHVRTSVSAQDFWTRERAPTEVSPDFRILPPNTDTPYGRQRSPHSGHKSFVSLRLSPGSLSRPPLLALPANMQGSRVVEKQVLSREIADHECVYTENARLRRANQRLELQVRNLLHINAALSKEMARAHNATRV